MTIAEDAVTRQVAGWGTAPRDVGRRVVAPEMIGRVAELESLAGALASPPAVAVIEGEAGIGKTCLVAALAARPEMAGRRWLVGACRRVREPFPLGPVIEALRGLGKELVGARLSPVAGVLRPLVPELEPWLPLRPEPLRDRAAERHRVFRALAELLGALGPTVLVVEDVHWADGQTVEFLDYVVKAQPERLGVVLTFRGEDVREGRRGIAARLPASTTVVRVELSPLDAAETAALAESILDAESISAEFAAFLFGCTEGVPFVIEEVIGLLRERGALVRRGRRWERRPLADLGVPKAVHESVRERVAQLSPEARALVEAAAVLEVPSPDEVLLAVAALERRAGASAIREAVDAGLLSDADGVIVFRHVLAAEAVYEGLPGVLRRELHRLAADRLATLEPCPLGQLAHHLKLARRIVGWVRIAEQAAGQAIRAGNDADAARLLRELLSEAPLDTQARVRVAAQLGHAALHGLAHRDACAVLRDVVQDAALPEDTRGELRLELGLLLDQAGDQVASYAELTAAVGELGHRPELRARAMAALAVPAVPGVPIEEHTSWLARSMAALEEIDDLVVRTAVLRIRAAVLLIIGSGSWRTAVRDIRWEATSPEHARELVLATQSVAVSACYTGHYAVAEEYVARGLAMCETLDYQRARLMLEAVRVAVDYATGRWDGLEARIAALPGALSELPPHQTDLEWISGCLMLARGDVKGARRQLKQALDLAERLADIQELAPPAAALARLYLAGGDADRAVACGMRCVSFLAAKGLWVAAAPAVPWMIEALTAAGKPGDATRLAERFAAGIEDKDAPLAAAALATARGVLAGAAQRPGEAVGWFCEAAEAYAVLPNPYEAAQARERAALAMFEAGDQRAKDMLLAALGTYRELGARWDLARCARAGRQHGVHLPVPYRGGRRGYGEALSPREREVAQLAAAGCTNKQIAERLFLSPSTVDKHLGRAMRKAGVHSRRELRTVLDEVDAGPAGSGLDGQA